MITKQYEFTMHTKKFDVFFRHLLNKFSFVRDFLDEDATEEDFDFVNGEYIIDGIRDAQSEKNVHLENGFYLGIEKQEDLYYFWFNAYGNF